MTRPIATASIKKPSALGPHWFDVNLQKLDRTQRAFREALIAHPRIWSFRDVQWDQVHAVAARLLREGSDPSAVPLVEALQSIVASPSPFENDVHPKLNRKSQMHRRETLDGAARILRWTESMLFVAPTLSLLRDENPLPPSARKMLIYSAVSPLAEAGPLGWAHVPAVERVPVLQQAQTLAERGSLDAQRSLLRQIVTLPLEPARKLRMLLIPDLMPGLDWIQDTVKRLAI